MGSAVIEVANLTRTYGSRRGIQDVNLSIPEGSLYGFLGPNGAGKTTTIRVLLGFLRATSGRASVFGLDAWRRSAEIKAEVGAIPGDLRLWPWLTGVSALKLFGRVRGRDLMAKGRALADELELDLKVRVRAMSRGMRQKLGLILALAHEPRLLILDEPTTGLDPLMQDRLREILRRMAKKGHTVFFSSHTLGEVESLCDRVAIVRQGRLVADDALDALQHAAGHEVTIVWKAPQDGASEGQARHAATGNSVPAEVPDFLVLTERTPTRWVGSLRAPVSTLVEYLADKPLDDLTIARPDLESLFRRFYESDSRVEGLR
jgi:ABC-2 type transport system ATP-binding protein